MLVCIYICSYPVSMACVLSWSNNTDRFTTTEENFFNCAQDQCGVPGRSPAVVQVITYDCGKEALSFSHEGFESLTLASLAPVVAKCANWWHMGKMEPGKRYWWVGRILGLYVLVLIQEQNFRLVHGVQLGLRLDIIGEVKLPVTELWWMGTDIRMPETERGEEVFAWKGTRRPSRERGGKRLWRNKLFENAVMKPNTVYAN